MANDSLCQTAQLLSQSNFYISILFFKGVFNVAAVFTFIFHALARERPKIFHPNTKVIYWFICAFAFVMAINIIAYYVIEIWRLVYPYTDSCDRLWSVAVVFYFRFSYVVFLNGINSSMLVLCIERVICIIRISNYEKSSKPKMVTLFLIVIAIILSVVFFLLYSPGVQWTQKLALPTVRNANNATNFIYIIYYGFLTELLALACFFCLHFYALNLRKRFRGFRSRRDMQDGFIAPTGQPLSVKFQVEETLQMTQLFLPIAVAKIVLQCITSLVSYGLLAFFSNAPVAVTMIVYEINFMFYFEPIIIAFLLVYGSGQMKNLCVVETIARAEWLLH